MYTSQELFTESALALNEASQDTNSSEKQEIKKFQNEFEAARHEMLAKLDKFVQTLKVLKRFKPTEKYASIGLKIQNEYIYQIQKFKENPDSFKGWDVPASCVDIEQEYPIVKKALEELKKAEAEKKTTVYTKLEKKFKEILHSNVDPLKALEDSHKMAQDICGSAKTLSKISTSVETTSRKLTQWIKDIDPKYKLAGTLAISIAAYGLLYVKLKKLGFNKSPLNVVEVFKAVITVVRKGNIKDSAIVLGLSAIVIGGLSASGYYGYKIFKQFLENKEGKGEKK